MRGDAAVTIETSADIEKAHAAVREIADQLGFGPADQARLAATVEELGNNLVQYAGSGHCLIRSGSQASERRIEIEVVDDGPGISDLQQAMTDHPPRRAGSGSAIGTGLPAVKRLMSEFMIFSRPGHTRVKVALVRPL